MLTALKKVASKLSFYNIVDTYIEFMDRYGYHAQDYIARIKQTILPKSKK